MYYNEQEGSIDLCIRFLIFAPLLTLTFQICDGLIGEDILSRTFCGRSVPSKIMATSNALTVKFVSDDQGDGAGFMAEYSISSGSLFNSLKIINP